MYPSTIRGGPVSSPDVQQRLADERRRLVAELDRLRQELGVSDPAATLPPYESYGQHAADVASDAVEREIDRALELDLLALIGEVDEARHRDTLGTYGRCINCAAPIGVERLAAVPWARLCLQHQATAERDDRSVLDPAVPLSLFDDTTESDDEDDHGDNEFSSEELALHIENEQPSR